MSEVIASKIQEWRAKCADGTITQEEMREAIAAIRKERVQASEVSSKSRAAKAPKTRVAKPDGDALLSELGI